MHAAPASFATKGAAKKEKEQTLQNISPNAFG